MPENGNAYRESGVDIDAANRAVGLMKSHIRSTYDEHTLTDVGSFGGLFDVSSLKRFTHPVLVHSIDGAGTKTMIAETMNQWTVGQDIVNHCINDILTIGALPLSFMDYVGADKLQPEIMEKIIAQIAIACKQAGIPLISGETAEMPGVYQNGRHDLVGCIIGIVEKDDIIDGSKIAVGDVLIGLPSNGLHTNGYSLARKAFFETAGHTVDTCVRELDCTIGEELLKIHRCYLKMIKSCLRLKNIHGIAHITGGGLTDNIARLLPEGVYAEINLQWKIPPVFRLIQEIASVSNREMRRVFNLGIGMVLITSSEDTPKIIDALTPEQTIVIGEIKRAPTEAEKQKVVFAY